MTSLTETAVERSTVALAPDLSVMTILPREMPEPPLRDERSVSVASAPPPCSKEMEVSPTPEVSRSVKPRESCCWVETRRLTMNS
ncbi:MAG: hypothetical protein R3B46_08450 [Phycisphaerales bacterium]